MILILYSLYINESDALISRKVILKKALIVDDIHINIELLQAYLSLHSIESMGAITGQEGYETAQSYLPDVIFMDLLMPGNSWNGYEASIELKKNPLTQHIPIVAVSGAGNKEKAYEAGCDYFLIRPFQRAGLRNLLIEIGLIEIP